MKCARDLILDVLRGSRSIDEFVISKALRTGYKNPDSLPHVVVARKIQERTGAPPVSGDRVNYVFIRDAMNPDGLIAMWQARLTPYPVALQQAIFKKYAESFGISTGHHCDLQLYQHAVFLWE